MTISALFSFLAGFELSLLETKGKKKKKKAIYLLLGFQGIYTFTSMHNPTFSLLIWAETPQAVGFAIF